MDAILLALSLAKYYKLICSNLGRMALFWATQTETMWSQCDMHLSGFRIRPANHQKQDCRTPRHAYICYKVGVLAARRPWSMHIHG